MQNQPEFQAVGGQLHRVVYQPVDENSVEAEVQAQVDAAQNALNQATQTREHAEQVYTAAEAAAEAASLDLDSAKKVEVEAETAFQKSTSSRDALASAKQLATQQLEQENAAEGSAADVDGPRPRRLSTSSGTRCPASSPAPAISIPFGKNSKSYEKAFNHHCARYRDPSLHRSHALCYP
jgi:hypothetical protein